MPLLLAKKEVFEWVRQGKKTVDIRKGNPQKGDVAVFQSGPRSLSLKIEKKVSGKLRDLVRSDNYWLVIPSAENLEEAIAYFYKLYKNCEGAFTAYYFGELY